MPPRSKKTDTVLTHAGLAPEDNHGILNPPVYHASTVLFPTVAAMEAAQKNRNTKGTVSYGRHGTPTAFALEEAVAAAENGARGIAYCSGVAACHTAILAFVKAGDHLLMVDSVYDPVRSFCSHFLKRFGIETTFYDPLIGGGITTLIRANTRLIYMESPGSLTFEIQDVPAIVAVAQAHSITTVLDNTWASPLFFRPLDHGVDVSVISGTKYIGGHSDAMIGFAVCTEKSFPAVRQTTRELGYHAAPDDCYLALRGLRSAAVRLRHHERQALALADWLGKRPEVERVLHPALPGHPGHDIWQRDFTGSSGLFGIALRPDFTRKATAALLDGMELFGMGYSWGGFESLILPVHLEQHRSARPWTGGPLIRIHAGLEDVDDLIADLERGFQRLNAAR